MNEKELLPAWMCEEEIYEPNSDKDGFIVKSTLAIIGVLSKVRMDGTTKSTGASTPLKLLYTIVFVILTACSSNMVFTLCMIAGVLVRLCILPGNQLKSICKAAMGAAVFSAILLLPAVFLGSPRTMLSVASKVLVSVSLMGLLAHTTRWNDLTGSLRFYRVPDLFIFTFDITLKYIVMLGNVCLDMLQALRMRSVGKNNKKGRSISGVLGVTFLKSKEMSEEMYGAMCCRGFEGEYHTNRHVKWKKIDIFYALFMLAVVGLFIYLERAMG